MSLWGSIGSIFRPTALPPDLVPLLSAMLDPCPRRRPTAGSLLRTEPMRRAARWRPYSRLLDVGLRRGASIIQSCMAALWHLWASLWGWAMGQSSPITPPHSPLRPHIDPWDEEEEEEEDEAPWGHSPHWSPTTFGPIDTPRHRGKPLSPTSMGRLRRTLTFDED
ncbi:membrane-associated tyrosine- and threonine-specific cdc2-inhibitory kinase-like isoform X2 [Coturnix japonica]|uniref:membrane-associated tyrosine- and threonine-specific cdc2-inhibitory kinase-like isoform X2 n=1 Tax=Coturnix japonica TaxID=93934 RepID=UPI000777372E|nr:membrane-associated tyrosine- and threonine-specific cdc2-inhibitory kinase-like isoform X2 [Coturnix japonica]